MSFRVSQAVAGQIENLDDPLTRMIDKSAVALTKGVLTNLNSTNHNYEICPTNGKKPFALCVRDAAAADLKFEGLEAPFYGYVTTTTTLDPGDYVKPSTTVAGQVERFVIGTSTEDQRVGQYRGRATHIVRDHAGKYTTGQAAIGAVVLVRFL